MTLLLLTTKLNLPVHQARWVPRPHLIERLEAGLRDDGGFSRKLTLVSASAGYGKTTLVTDWLSIGQYPTAWLSLDENDNDPLIFLSYLVAAIQTVQPAFGTRVRSLLQNPQPYSPQALLTLLVNEIAAIPTRLTLVLDDYHHIHSTPIHQQIEFILEHQPTNLHLILATREDPLLPLGRLRARGQLLEIRQADLRFSLPETAEFFRRTMGIDLPDKQIEVLERRTEGWVAGLQLAALSIHDRQDVNEFVQDFAGSNRFILDYLIDEIFTRQTDAMQAFLLKTSILDQLCASLCDALLQQPDINSQDILQRLEQANLFVVTLDHKREWYRYHHLFSELLRYRLYQMDPQQAKVLHQRASQWYVSQALYPAAIQHSLAAEDWEQAVRLLVLVNDRMFKQGEVVTLLNWLECLPETLVHSQPQLGLMLAWVLLLTSQFDRAAEILTHVEQIVPPPSPVAGQIATARAYLARSLGKMDEVVDLSEMALSLLSKTDFVARSNVAMNLGLAYWHKGEMNKAQVALLQAVEDAQKAENIYALLTARIFLARIIAVRGELQRAAIALEEIVRPGGRVPILALAYYDLFTIFYEWNDLERAALNLELGLEIAQESHNMEFICSGYVLRVLLSLAQNDLRGAMESAEQSLAMIKDYPIQVRDRTYACLVHLGLIQSDLKRAEYWLEQMTCDVDIHPFCRFLSLTRPRLLLARGEKQAARALFEQAATQARQAGLGACHLNALLLQALCLDVPQHASQMMLQVLEQAQPEGYLRLFLDLGEPVRVNLLHLRAEARQSRLDISPQLMAYLDKILAAFPAADSLLAKHSKAELQQFQPGLVEPLSGRELEVLVLLVAGLSNRQIADKLVVSLGTVKTHIHNIYGKLEVTNRAQAIARARELGLV